MNNPDIPWTPPEEKRLAALISSGQSTKQIAFALGRTTDAVRQKSFRLRLVRKIPRKLTVTVELPTAYATKLRKLASIKQITMEAAVHHALSIVLGSK